MHSVLIYRAYFPGFSDCHIYLPISVAHCHIHYGKSLDRFQDILVALIGGSIPPRVSSLVSRPHR